MSPEQARGEVPDARSDLFSLGAVLYEMATGRRPFRGDTPDAVRQTVRHQEPERPRAVNSAVPRALERVILRALEKDVAARWQSAASLAGALRRVDSRRASRLLPTAALAACVLAAGVLAVWLWMKPAAMLAERDAIVIADFENSTGDPAFDGALRQALLSQMGQSRYLSIVSENRVQSVLRAMSRPPGERLERGVALEICQRTGAKAVVAGRIGTLGSRYFVGLEAVGCAGGEALASEYAEAESKERVLAAVGRTVAQMRGRLGESLASIQRPGALPEATTPSLDALKAYSVAVREKVAGNDPTRLLDRAIQLDPDFASAHFTLARTYLGRGWESEGEAAITRAYALRGRANERERLAIEGMYHAFASGDAPQAIAAGMLGLQLYPGDSAVWRWLVPAYARTGELDKALEIARREVKVDADEGGSYHDVALALIGLGRTAEAGDVFARAEARGIRSELFPFVRYILAALNNDFAAMEREAALARGAPFEDRIVMLRAQTAGYFGQLVKARETERCAAQNNLRRVPALSATVALTEALFGLEREAKSRAKAAIQIDRGRRTAAPCALALALSHEPAEAQRIVSELLRSYPNDTLLKGAWSPAVLGAIALNRGDARRALEVANGPVRTGCAVTVLFFIRGVVCLRLGLASDAMAEFGRVIEMRGSLFASGWVDGSAFLYPAAQLGLARALAMAGRVEESRKAYEEFFAGWSRADPDIPILVQARREYAALARASGPAPARTPR
jgi:tetratricopeptide (TPR) repeat protein